MHIFGVGQAKRMMHGVEAARLRIVFKHRRVHNPQKIELILRNQVQSLAPFRGAESQATARPHLVYRPRHITKSPVLAPHTVEDFVHLLLREKLGDVAI